MKAHTLLLSGLALALGTAVQAQDDVVVRPVLDGEKATILFSPHGGYAKRNYLKRFQQGDQPTWATQNGAVAELIRRCPKGSKIRIGTFKLSDDEIVNALFTAARDRNVEVKLWLKGPPGLTYMVPRHEEIAQRANRYLRQRAQQNKQDVWGDFQVQIGTAAKMDAFGKWNDMHEKFGIVALNPDHAPGYNHAFLGTSNLGSSSDKYHNESRVFFLENPKATQRLWQEFDRLWRHLGDCETFVDGDPQQGPNQTAEGPTRIKLPTGGFADEEADDPLQFRFTYERRNGSFHRISDDFVRAIREARHLDDGASVYIGQFGFQISKISRALQRAARRSPEVRFRVMVHMKEGDSWALRQLVNANLDNLEVAVKWDSHKLKLGDGTRPGLPGPGDPGPSLLHHKTLVVGDRVMITGSFNFFGDADDQGENVVIIRNHVDDTYAHLLEDAQTEYDAMWDSGVLFDARKLFGNDGLYEVVQRYSKKKGFLEAIRRLSSSPKSIDDLHTSLTSDPELADLTKAEVKDYADVLERFAFADKDADGKLTRHPDPDATAHAEKPTVRARAKEPPEPVEISGEVTLVGDGLLLVDGTKRYLLKTGPTARTLRKFEGRTATVLALVGEADADGRLPLDVQRLISPAPGTLRGVAKVEGDERFIEVGTRPIEAFGPLARGVEKAKGLVVTATGWSFSEGDTLKAFFVERLKAKVERETELSYNFAPTGHVVEPGDEVWIDRISRSGRYALIRHGDARGYIRVRRLGLGVKPSDTGGIIGGLDDD